MADEKIHRDPEQTESRHDPEHETPDPEQVEQDRKEAEREYGSRDREAA